MTWNTFAKEQAQGQADTTAEDDAKDSSKNEAAYGNGPGYWNDRYRKDPEPFDWLESFEDLRAFIEDASGGSKLARFLHIGCGNSVLSENMYDAGYHNIVNIDNASVVIQQMADRNTARPEMTWLDMDATDMESLRDASFDVAIDKSVLDTFACGNDAAVTIITYLMEVSRVLRPGGTFLCISYGGPDTRLDFLKMSHLKFHVQEVVLPAKSQTAREHYVYVCRKPPMAARS
eukprot:TRINITY_DN26768_c0_g1_i2.p2 TRINITY_DN26768_c0_g1~~TRINITY_DN26768_c0_g1_i2.p2  ORF type:complete len:232 (-),score=51.20 TRINITY_DN26768_c0_g1_i2:51-746(-)